MKTEEEIVTGTVYVWAKPRTAYQIENNPDEPMFDYEIGLEAHWDDNAIRVMPIDVCGEVPDGIDLLGKAIKTMKQSIANIEDEAARKIKVLEEKIRGLSLIEHRSSETR